MTIPDFQSIMLPLLRIAGDSREHNIHEAVNELAKIFGVSEEEQAKLLPSGQQPVFYNRVGWARTYLKKAGLLIDPRRGFFEITDRGKDVLSKDPTRIDMKYLRQFPEYIEFRETTRNSDQQDEVDELSSSLTPEEELEEAYIKIREDLGNELLDYVTKSTPGFF